MPLGGGPQDAGPGSPLLLSGGPGDTGPVGASGWNSWPTLSGAAGVGRAGQLGVEWGWGSPVGLCWASSFLGLQPESCLFLETTFFFVCAFWWF